ncbi:hypothetical protein EYB26_006841 [Talaromyces marneffei]|uniref:uncharacterized protein n=1 Tax=Talaromyces marneffei TaxID=37727 RepID=UPI0012A816C2|nr:uncharacterized protein EYB26_006841 [Talaromyces marneffei]QGA19153.1 hypothetical protein EYB26_006841 [Talaromyces marneffei]
MAPPLTQETRFALPGLTLPLKWKPNEGFGSYRELFPCALDPSQMDTGGYLTFLRTKREILMMRIMNTITDKPDWDRKIYNPDITSKWATEIVDSGADVTPKMLEWIWAELKHKAEILKENGGMVTAFNPGVVISDTAISKELREDLKTAVLPLEQVPEDEKDYHPGSDQRVVDLVHPSLFPVVYGRTRILCDEILTRDGYLSWSGKTETLPQHSDPEGIVNSKLKLFSTKFQWLPCDVEFAEDDEKGCRIISYINNLQPQKHKDLYQVIEKVITKAIPLWDESLDEAVSEPKARISYESVEYLPSSDPEPDWQEDEDGYEAWHANRPIKQPEPQGDFQLLKHDLASSREPISLRKRFREKGLQIIVKLANIELTPDKPRYEGGTWHVEGQLNERICATAIYYYSTENITQSTLSFRTRADLYSFDDVDYPQSRHEFLQHVYGFGPDTNGWGDCPITQDLGDVSCHEGRLLTFPNALQHRVSPFELADKTKPGHRKILALFLVDPHIRIISTANVPPQRADWLAERDQLRATLLERKLPVELTQMVLKDLDDIPISMEEAKQYREELMEERRAVKDEQSDMFSIGSFSLCEH